MTSAQWNFLVAYNLIYLKFKKGSLLPPSDEKTRLAFSC